MEIVLQAWEHEPANGVTVKVRIVDDPENSVVLFNVPLGDDKQCVFGIDCSEFRRSLKALTSR